jgi:hypothetical protein
MTKDHQRNLDCRDVLGFIPHPNDELGNRKRTADSRDALLSGFVLGLVLLCQFPFYLCFYSSNGILFVQADRSSRNR